MMKFKHNGALIAGAVEYTECISEDEYDSTNVCLII